MEIMIVTLCIADFVLTAVLLIRFWQTNANKNSEEDKRQEEIVNPINDLKERVGGLSQRSLDGNKNLLDEIARRAESTTNQIENLSARMMDFQEKQQNKINGALDKIQSEMAGLRSENRGSLDQINSVVTEKMQKTLDEKLNGMSETVVRNMAELGKRLDEGQARQQKSNEEKLEKLADNFEKIRNDINSTLQEIRASNFESMEKLRRDNQESLDKINNTVNEKLQKTLDDKFSQSFEAVNKRLAQVYEGLGEMKNVASGVSDLKNVLSNVKTRGILGEIQLGAIMSEILAPEQYGEQVSVVPGSAERVDFAVKLPGMEDGDFVYLPIDSKFPGNTYANLVDAYDSGNPEELREKRKNLETEINRSAKSIRDKYIAPPHTTGFAIMFLPFEGLYAEVVNMGLVESLQRQYKVNIAGPSTMAAMLNSLQMGFRTLAIQKKSGEVWKILEAAKKEFSTFEDVLNQTRTRLRQADESLDKLIGTRTRAINRKLSTVSALSSAEEAENMLAE